MGYSPGWYARMLDELDRGMRQKEYEAKRREWDRQKAEKRMEKRTYV